MIFKIVKRDQWEAARSSGHFLGASIDLQDGFIHFSTKEQVRETAAKHFAGQDDLCLIAMDESHFGAELKWEPSRGGDLFPHLYGALPFSSVQWEKPLVVDPTGTDSHVFPNLEIEI